MNVRSRRDVIKLAGVGSLAMFVPVIGRMPGTMARAEEILDPENPQAKALGYVHDYEDVDPAAWPRYEAGQTCANCQLALGDLEAEWMGCGLFPGKQVAGRGWCNAWVKRQG